MRTVAHDQTNNGDRETCLGAVRSDAAPLQRIMKAQRTNRDKRTLNPRLDRRMQKSVDPGRVLDAQRAAILAGRLGYRIE